MTQKPKEDLSKIRPLPVDKTVNKINLFVVQSVDYINHFDMHAEEVISQLNNYI